jgi:hypothetical protein
MARQVGELRMLRSRLTASEHRRQFLIQQVDLLHISCVQYEVFRDLRVGDPIETVEVEGPLLVAVRTKHPRSVRSHCFSWLRLDSDARGGLADPPGRRATR